MIVDCHSHVQLYPEHLTDTYVAEAARVKPNEPVNVNSAPADHWAAMEPVDRVIVFGLRAKHTGLLIPNDFVADYVKQHPQKLIGFASVDPNEADYLDELTRATDRLGLRGLKLGPIYQNYHPLDERMLPVYAYCEQKELPILIHQGTTFPRMGPLKYAPSVLLEDIAFQYPNLKMIIAHMGHPWIGETVALIRKQPNFYADISALFYRPWQFYNAVMAAVEYAASDKLLFGSDYPFTTPRQTIDSLRNINHVTGNSGLPRIPETVIEDILHRDTLSLLGLS
jgi:predicted TIM-barrel fold metal-dependent hydrolase